MNLVDSCGWLEYLSDGPNADFYVFPLLKTNQLLVPVICIYEVYKKILTEKSENEAFQAVALMHQGLIIDVDVNISLNAARISYENKLPMADSLILASAREYDAIVWTQDKHFKDILDAKFKIKRC